MQQTHTTPATEHPAPAAPRSPLRRRLLYAALTILVILALIFGPPLVNVGRYQRRVATSISNSLGRPVHLDRVSLNLLPLPGFTIENLVVGEDPAFGAEPIIRANQVHATLRFSSLWRRQVEFSTISFTDPSVNLVHTSNGRWNIEGVLLQASRIETAPTAQRRAGPAPRFPYIEATGARLNFKEDQEKLPYSLIDSQFALWLPDPHQWHFRLKARPTRTDMSVSDTGTIELESILSAAPAPGGVPINLQGQWRNAQLGEATRVLFGHDAGFRGEMNLSANIRGTLAESAVTTRLRLTDARRADFVPDHPLNAEAECFATATHIFHVFEDLRCSWPPDASANPPAIALTGSIPDILRPRDSHLQIGTSGLPASTLISWLHLASRRAPANLAATGTLSGSLSYNAAGQEDNQWHGDLTLRDATLTTPETGTNSLLSGNILLRSGFPSSARDDASRHETKVGRRRLQPSTTNPSGFQLAPTSLALGGREPATLEGHIDGEGYTLHLTGMATADRLDALTRALPALGDGLAEALPPNPATGAFRIDLTATRPWGGPQTWLASASSTHQPPEAQHKARRNQP
jgi:AsmA protein